MFKKVCIWTIIAASIGCLYFLPSHQEVSNRAPKGFSVTSQGSTLIGWHNGKKVWQIYAENISVSADGATTTLTKVYQGVLFDQDEPRATFSAEEAIYHQNGNLEFAKGLTLATNKSLKMKLQYALWDAQSQIMRATPIQIVHKDFVVMADELEVHKGAAFIKVEGHVKITSEKGVDITVGKISYDDENQRFALDGGIEAVIELDKGSPNNLTADQAEVLLAANTLSFSGNVKLFSPQYLLTAQQITYIRDAQVLHVDGDVLFNIIAVTGVPPMTVATSKMDILNHGNQFTLPESLSVAVEGYTITANKAECTNILTVQGVECITPDGEVLNLVQAEIEGDSHSYTVRGKKARVSTMTGKYERELPDDKVEITAERFEAQGEHNWQLWDVEAVKENGDMVTAKRARMPEKGHILFSNDVQIKEGKGQYTLKATTFLFSTDNHQGRAEGDIRVVSAKGAILTCNEANVYLRRKEIEVYNTLKIVDQNGVEGTGKAALINYDTEVIKVRDGVRATDKDGTTALGKSLEWDYVAKKVTITDGRIIKSNGKWIAAEKLVWDTEAKNVEFFGDVRSGGSEG